MEPYEVLLEEFIDREGIVVEWPHGNEQMVKALIDYTKDLERQLEECEKT